jgi:hypothetical protein
MLVSLRKTTVVAAFALGLAFAGAVMSPADAAMRQGGGGAMHGGGGGAMHGGGGGGGGWHGGGGGGWHGGGGAMAAGGGGAWHGSRRGAGHGGGGWRGGYGGGGREYGNGYGYGYGYGYGGAALGLGLLGGAIIGSQYPYYDSGYGYAAEYNVDPQDEGGDSPTYCASRFRSYDPASGTYLGYDGLRHPCP